MKKIIILFILFFAILNGHEIKKIDVQFNWKHQFEFAGFYTALEKGYYNKANLDVNFYEYNNNIDIVNDVINSKMTFGLGGSELITSRLKNKPIVLVSNYFKYSPVAIVTQKDIKTPKNLENKTLMIPKSYLESIEYKELLKMFNVNAKSIKIIKPSFKIEDFINKKVDAYSIFITNELYKLSNSNTSYNILNPSSYGIQTYEGNLFTNQEFATKNYKEVKAFLEATNKGWQYALENKEEIVELILEKYNTQHKTKDELLFEAKEIEKNNAYKYISYRKHK